MKFDKLTIKSQEAVGEAQSLASSRGHSGIEPAHLLRALLAQPEGSTVPVLQKLGVPIEPLQQAMERRLGQIPKVTGVTLTWFARGNRLTRAVGRRRSRLRRGTPMSSSLTSRPT